MKSVLSVTIRSALVVCAVVIFNSHSAAQYRPAIPNQPIPPAMIPIGPFVPPPDRPTLLPHPTYPMPSSIGDCELAKAHIAQLEKLVATQDSKIKLLQDKLKLAGK